MNGGKGKDRPGDAMSCCRSLLRNRSLGVLYEYTRKEVGFSYMLPHPKRIIAHCDLVSTCEQLSIDSSLLARDGRSVSCPAR